MSRGAFFDRRAFLISYDPTQDPTGTVLEGTCWSTAPVGAGISLEYYFSTVNNERYGCGTKITHNVAGLLRGDGGRRAPTCAPGCRGR